jgi:hypothetical protein
MKIISWESELIGFGEIIETSYYMERDGTDDMLMELSIIK